MVEKSSDKKFLFSKGVRPLYIGKLELLTASDVSYTKNYPNGEWSDY